MTDAKQREAHKISECERPGGMFNSLSATLQGRLADRLSNKGPSQEVKPHLGPNAADTQCLP